MLIRDEHINNILKDEYNKVKLELNGDSTVAEVIFDYLIDLNGFEKGDFEPSVRKYYQDKLTEKVSKGLPIDIFVSDFVPKGKFEEFTNYIYTPDINDLRILIRFNKIVKNIRSIYPYGFRIFVVYKGDSFKNMLFLTDNESNKYLEKLVKLNEYAEEITKTRNSVKLITWKKFLGPEAKTFQKVLYKRAIKYYNNWSEKKEPTYSRTEKEKQEIGKFYHLTHSDPFFSDFFVKEVCKIRALNRLLLREIELVDTIKKLNPNLIIASTDVASKYLTIETTDYLNYEYLYTLTTYEGGKWSFKPWSKIKDGPYKAVYLKEDNSKPLFFEKI